MYDFFYKRKIRVLELELASLTDRVYSLEQGTKINVKDNVTPVYPYYKDRFITTKEAIRKIADHLEINFEYVPAKTEMVVLKKKET